MNMSKKTEESGYGSAENTGWPDETPQAETPQAKTPAFLAIEEHAKTRRISAPVFAAVRQMNGWSEGKKVSEAVFNEAVNAFLGAPIGGKR
jgi:hypothetical protein